MVGIRGKVSVTFGKYRKSINVCSEPVFVNVYGAPKESIPQDYVSWRAGTTNRVAVLVRQAGNRFLGSLKDLRIPSLDHILQNNLLIHPESIE
jgi:hypothetical protein